MIHRKKWFKQKTASSFEILSLIKSYCDNQNGLAIMGNNEYAVLANLVTPEKIIRKKELKETFRELRDMEFKAQMKWLRWLQDLPHFVILTESFSKRKFQIAHAFHSETVEEAVFGPNFLWYKDPEFTSTTEFIWSPFSYIFGHYGYPYVSLKSLCIDATNLGGVGVLVTDPYHFAIFN